jgi:uncharacterized protein (TIGR02268 family)
MPNLPHWPALLWVLAASIAGASDRLPIERNLFLSEHPRMDTPSIYVGGRVATVLHFEQPCDPARTKMLGWEGRFEPLLVGGRSVVLFPLRDLTPDDRFLLLVTLADGTELPFTVTAWEQTYSEREVDQQVNVYANREGYNGVLSSLYDSLKRERELREKVERYEQEDSVDHALAALLAKGAVAMTPFRLIRKQVVKGEGMALEVQTFTDTSKAAILFRVTNHDPVAPWKLMEARLRTSSTGEARPFVLRMDRDAILPDESGSIAVVADRSAFVSRAGTEQLTLELFRSDGIRQACVLVDPPIGH